MRRAGLLIPLFSCQSTRSWGIGDIGDVPATTKWLAGAGQSVLQLLPLNEMAAGQQSPYSAISAMAIDPIFIDMSQVEDFTAVGGEASLAAADRQSLSDVRRAPRIDYANVRRLKQKVLAAAFERFFDCEWRLESARARALGTFVEAEASWLDNYALFRAIHDRESGRPWLEWPQPLKVREPAALDQARRELAREALYYQYLQWIADTEWRQARASAAANGVRLLGDLPFMVDGDSADVWLRQGDFFLDVSVGVPPDAFSATGQDWGMPAYHWEAMAAGGFSWLRDRARRSAELFDGYRVDHLVGFYRTYGRPRNGGAPFFNPAEEPLQIGLGESVLGLMREPGSEIIAEDLGIVPEFVRESLARLGVPGFRVFRWERIWHQEGQPFRDPSEYPAISVATTGTHDTEPLATWWDQLPSEDRLKVAALPGIQAIRPDVNLDRPFDAQVRDALLELLFASGSDLLLLPIQDVFGWTDRINEPATVNRENWTFRLPWPCDRLDEIPEARERQSQLLTWGRKYMR
jgi:4-alpha-glucanotransferase